MKRILILVMVIVILFCGCVPDHADETDTRARVVTQVRVSLIPDDEPFRVYTDEKKMGWILDYIDSIYGEENPRKVPVDDSGSWCVTCVYANGEEKEYYLRDGRYFREEDGSWLRIESCKTGFTQFLLCSPSDKIQPSDTEQNTEVAVNDAIKVPPV